MQGLVLRLVAVMAQRLAREKRANKSVVLYLTVPGAILSGIGSLLAQDWTLSLWLVLAIVGVVLLAVGTWFQYLNAAGDDHFDLAVAATQAQNTALVELDNSRTLTAVYERMITILQSLYSVMQNGRHVVEDVIAAGAVDEVLAVDTVLRTVRRDMQIALGFSPLQIWTIVVYRREQDQTDRRTYLRCISHDRQIACDLRDARRWPEGVGVGGLALLRDAEIVAPDMLDPVARPLYNLDTGDARDDDYVRYRSMIAIPVNVGNDDRPWGVVLASSDQPRHFLTDGADDDDVEAPLRAEAIRAFGGLVALTVAGTRKSAHDAGII